MDPGTCIDCGACVPECRYSAIFAAEDVPSAYRAAGGELLNRPGLTGRYEGANHYGEALVLETTRVLAAGETVDLTLSIQENEGYYR